MPGGLIRFYAVQDNVYRRFGGLVDVLTRTPQNLMPAMGISNHRLACMFEDIVHVLTGLFFRLSGSVPATSKTIIPARELLSQLPTCARCLPGRVLFPILFRNGPLRDHSAGGRTYMGKERGQVRPPRVMPDARRPLRAIYCSSGARCGSSRSHECVHGMFPFCVS